MVHKNFTYGNSSLKNDILNANLRLKSIERLLTKSSKKNNDSDKI